MSKARTAKTTSKDDPSQWIFALPDDCITEGNERPSLHKLRHPRTDQGSMFLFSHCNKKVYEVLQFKDDYRTWLIDDSVQGDGSMFVATPMDPLFLMLPYLKKEAESDKFMQLEQMLFDAEFPECARLTGAEQQLAAVADKKGDDDLLVWRYNVDKTLAWLSKKVDKLCKVLLEKKVNVSEGEQADIYLVTNTKEQKETRHRYAYGMVSDYLPADLAEQLKTHLNIKDEEITHEKPHIEQPNPKKAKTGSLTPSEDYSTNGKPETDKKDKQTRAQKQLGQVDKSGMKNIMSFFAKKPAKK